MQEIKKNSAFIQYIFNFFLNIVMPHQHSQLPSMHISISHACHSQVSHTKFVQGITENKHKADKGQQSETTLSGVVLCCTDRKLSDIVLICYPCMLIVRNAVETCEVPMRYRSKPLPLFEVYAVVQQWIDETI